MYRNCIFSFILLVLFFPVANAIADSQWQWMHPYPTGADIQGIFFDDENNGWIVTDIGEIFRTDDAGATWLKQIDELDLRGVFFISPTIGFACGIHNTEGIVWLTTNGGSSWAGVVIGSERLNAVEFTDLDYGTMVGENGTIYRTMNSGYNWTLQGSGTTKDILDVSFISSTEGWVCGDDGLLLHTETSGAFWDEMATPYGADYSGIQFIDSENGFMAGCQYILNTNDEVDSWTVSFTQAYNSFKSIELNGNYGIAPGTGGVAVSTDYGAMWAWEELPDQPPTSTCVQMLSSTVPSSSEAYLAGNYGLIYGRNSSGELDLLSKHETLRFMSSITHFGVENVWACGLYGTLMRSSDGGVNWVSQIWDEVEMFSDIVFSSLSTGYCVGSNNIYGDGIILKTLDGGVNWEDITPVSFDVEELVSVDFMDENNGLAVGSDGEILYTTDGGANWTEKTEYPAIDFQRVRFGDTDKGWAVGSSGSILCFDFNSDSWSEQTSPMTQTFYGLYPLNKDTVWAVGWNGTVTRTNNGGENWETIAITGNDYSDVWFADNGLDGYFAGRNALFGSSSNGGYSVSHSDEDYIENRLWALSFIDAGYGWGCGAFGAILRLGENPSGIEDDTNTFINPVQTQLHVACNPFTEASVVSFTIPHQRMVVLNLFDLSGRIIQNIHRGELSRGEYCFVIEGADLQPGIYFIMLVTDDIITSKPIVRII